MENDTIDGSKIGNAKLVFLGDVGMGKCLLPRFVKGQFVEIQTLAANNRTIKFDIWDTTKQERYPQRRAHVVMYYYQGAATAATLVVYDCTNAVDYFFQLKAIGEAPTVKTTLEKQIRFRRSTGYG